MVYGERVTVSGCAQLTSTFSPAEANSESTASASAWLNRVWFRASSWMRLFSSFLMLSGTKVTDKFRACSTKICWQRGFQILAVPPWLLQAVAGKLPLVEKRCLPVGTILLLTITEVHAELCGLLRHEEWWIKPLRHQVFTPKNSLFSETTILLPSVFVCESS